MTVAGFAEWSAPLFLLDRPYLNGAFLSGPMVFPVSRVPSPGLLLLPTEAGTHIAQVPYEGSKSPADKIAWEFHFSFRPVDSQDDHRAVMIAMAKGAPVYFTAGQPVWDTFEATSAETYKLTRPQAYGIVSDLSLLTEHAYRVYYNGAHDDSKATVSGQTVTANATGTITIEYCPVHLVKVELSESLDDSNTMVLNVTLTEVVQGTFDA